MKILTNSLLDMVRFASRTNNKFACEVAASIGSFIVAWSLMEHETRIPDELRSTYLELVSIVNEPHLYPQDMKTEEEQLQGLIEDIMQQNNIDGVVVSINDLDPEDPDGPQLA